MSKRMVSLGSAVVTLEQSNETFVRVEIHDSRLHPRQPAIVHLTPGMNGREWSIRVYNTEGEPRGTLQVD